MSQPAVATIPEFSSYIDEMRNKKDIVIYRRLIVVLIHVHHPNHVIQFFIDKYDIDSLRFIASLGGVPVNKELFDYAARNGKFIAIYSATDCFFKYQTARDLLIKYDFKINVKFPEDAFIIALQKRDIIVIKKIISNHNVANIFEDFAIRYVCEYGDIELVKLLLTCNNVDPSTHDDFSIKIVKAYGYYDIALELFRHPLVPIDEIWSSIIDLVIRRDCLSIAERIFNEGSIHTVSHFKDSTMISLMLMRNNRVTLLALKKRIIIQIPDECELQSHVVKFVNRKIKKYGANPSICIPYVKKSYIDNVKCDNVESSSDSDD